MAKNKFKSAMQMNQSRNKQAISNMIVNLNAWRAKKQIQKD